MGQDEYEVLDWVGQVTEGIVKNFDSEFDVIEALTKEEIGGGVNQVLADVFKTYKVPKRLRTQVIENILESGDETYFGVMQAITACANDPALPEHFVTTLMEIGGDLAHNALDRCPTCKHSHAA